MKYIGEFLAGVAILIVGAIVFLQNVTVGSMTFLYRMNGVSVGAIMLLIIAMSFIWLLVKPSTLTLIVFGALWIAFFVLMIISTDIYVSRMTGLQFVLEIGILCVGIALIIHGVSGVKQ